MNPWAVATLFDGGQTGVVTVEIERKFLIEHVPVEASNTAGARIRQGYLVDGDLELRVRIEDGDATLTVKAGHGLTRTEVVAVITVEEAEALWPHTQGRRIDKVRHRVTLGDHVAEVDVYEGDLAGLAVVEVEFQSELSSRAFDPPLWFGREVTGESGWANASLARHGRPIA